MNILKRVLTKLDQLRAEKKLGETVKEAIEESRRKRRSRSNPQLHQYRNQNQRQTRTRTQSLSGTTVTGSIGVVTHGDSHDDPDDHENILDVYLY